MTELDDFECQRNIEYGYMDGLLEVISNPDMNTDNNSINVGKYTRTDWQADDVIVFDFKQTLSLVDTESIYLKVWSVLLKTLFYRYKTIKAHLVAMLLTSLKITVAAAIGVLEIQFRRPHPF